MSAERWTCRRPRRPSNRSAALLGAITVLAGCNVLVHVPVPPEDSTQAGGAMGRGVAPLSSGELLRFSGRNLGEVAPGLLYRSAAPSAALIEFLGSRCGLGHILSLRGAKDMHVYDAFCRKGGEVSFLSLSAGRDPTPLEILEMVRATIRAKHDGTALLMHCKAGADRTGVMVAIWRMLFQGVTDRDALLTELFLHRHVSFVYPNVRRTILRFRPELFRPFIDDPSLLDDPESVARLTARYHGGQPLSSGDTRLTFGPLEAGAAKADLLVGYDGAVPMATYGPFPPHADGIRLPVYARALVLDNGRTRLAIASCDLLIIDAPLREAVERKLRERNVRLDDLLLAATHTHTSIGGYVDHWAFELYMLGAFRETMRDHLAGRVAEAIREASLHLHPARLGAGRAFADHLTHNRRWGTTIDPEIGILRVVAQSGEPLALVANFACHPVMEAADSRIAGDFPARLAERLEEHHGLGIFLQGALGDTNPNHGPARGDEGEAAPANVVAGELAGAIEAAIGGIELEDEIALGALTELVDLPPTNVGVIPDMLFPADWIAAAAVSWPRHARLQAMRVGDAALIATSSELGSRLGLRIKRRIPAPFPFVVTHANGYTGYAVTPFAHALRKIDPTSLVSMNGSTHGAVIVEAACDLAATHWKRRIGPDERWISPARAARHGVPRAPPSPASEAGERARWEDAFHEERREALLDSDPTHPQTRSREGMPGDSFPDRLRIETSFEYRDEQRGGTGVVGRRREARLDLAAQLGWDMRLGISAGYLRSDWSGAGASGDDEGATDLQLALGRAFPVVSDRLGGNALRAIPRLGLSAPVGDPEPFAPFALAASSGVWRPSAGGALELVWESYRTLTLGVLWTGAFDSRGGRRPGDRIETSIGYRERHGLVSLALDLSSEMRLPDRRRGGLLAVDVSETSFELSLRPGLVLHAGPHVDGYVEGVVSLARGGTGAGSGNGVLAGLRLSF